MRMKIRRTFFWLILIAFVGLSIWQVFRFPYEPERLYSAIPSNALFVSEHDKLSERWQGIAKNPLMLNVLGACGVKTNDICKIVEDRVTNDLIGRFASRKTLIAYVPSFGESREPAWVMASWAGGNGQLLRWGLLSSLMCDFETVQMRGGQKIWTLKTSEQDDGERLSLAVYEGMLLGCLSRDRLGVQHLVEEAQGFSAGWREVTFRYLVDRSRNGRQNQGAIQRMIESAPEKDCPDKGWLLGLDSRNLIGKPILRLGVASFEGNSVAGWLRGSSAAPGCTNKPLDTANAKELRQMLGDSPSAFVLVPSDNVETVVSSGPGYLKTIVRTLRTGMVEGSPFFTALLNPEYSGRILGVKVPTIVIGAQMKEGDKALDLVVATLDKLNSRYGWALIPNRTEVDGHPLIVVESTRWSIYDSMKSEERVAFAVNDGWLIFSSNMASLKKLIQTQVAHRTNNTAGATWANGMASKPASAYGWVDLAATSKAAKDVIAVATLVTLVSGRGSENERTEQRKALDTAKTIADAMGSLKTGSFWVNTARGETEISFKLGDDKPSLPAAKSVKP
jgi:hypothetical protein